MLIQFSINNYKVFRKRATLSLVASEHRNYKNEPRNLTEPDRYKLRTLRSAVVYGANASGKSKFMEALVFMRRFVISSSKDGQKGNKIPVEPFRLNVESESAPSEFEVVFTFEDCLYRYGFEVDVDCVVAEWLYSKPKTREIEIFYREHQEFTTHPKHFTKGAMVVKEDMVRDNALLISVAAQFNDRISRKVIDWFQNIETIRDISSREFRSNAINKIKSATGKEVFLDYLKRADMGIKDLEVVEMGADASRRNTLSSVLTVRNKFCDTGIDGTVVFSLNEDESEGTKKYFYLLGPVIDALEKGSVLLVDELDAKLHPNLVEKVISLFNSPKYNTKNAQLIFNTHNTNLLRSGVFRRDQIWFTEKNRQGEARLYSLVDFQNGKSGKDMSFEDNYILGCYGAIPFLGEFDDYEL